LRGSNPCNPPLFDQTLLQSGVSLGWTAWDFGTRASLVRAQEAMSAASDAALTGSERLLAAHAVNAYLRVLTIRGSLAAQDQRLEALTAASTRMAQLVNEGKAARVDRLRIDAEAQRARADRIASASELDAAEHDLAQVTEWPITSVRAARLSALRLSDTAWAADMTGSLEGALIARAQGASSDVRELQARAHAAGANLDAVKAARFPEVRLSGAYVDRGAWSGDHAAEWQGAVALSYPFYSGGTREATIRRTAADERAASAQLRNARMDVERSVAQALASLREAHARAAALESAVEQSTEVTRIERLSIDVGSRTQTEYLDAEANLVRVRASLTEARHAEIAARVELARILGELSADWLARTVEPAQ
jgi:outer membrane protein TolC